MKYKRMLEVDGLISRWQEDRKLSLRAVLYADPKAMPDTAKEIGVTEKELEEWLITMSY